MVIFVIAGSGYDAGYALSDDGGNGSSGYPHLRESEKSEDHNRVKDDIGDGTASLRSHTEDCASGRSQ